MKNHLSSGLPEMCTKRFGRVFLYVAIAAIWPTLAVCPAWGQQHGATAHLPPPPVTSYDGSLLVSASAEFADLRLPVLSFVTTVRNDLIAASGANCGSRRRPVIVTLGEAAGTNAVSLTRARDVDGIIREQVLIADPVNVDLDELRYMLVRAFLRAHLADLVENGERGLKVEPPLWFSLGLSRRLVREHRLHDFDAVYRAWGRARLPLVQNLLVADSPAVRQPELAAMLTAFIGGNSLKQRLPQLMTHVLTDGGWRAEKILPLVADDGTAEAAERAWDCFMLDSARLVVWPGITTFGMLQRFCNQLPVFPADAMAPVGQAWRGLSPQALLAHAAQPWAQRLAIRQCVQLETQAIGRDATMQRVVQDYILFFRAVAEPSAHKYAAPLLQRADETLRRAAQAAAAQPLAVSVPEPVRKDN